MLEAKSASSLSHPNIVTIYEIGQDVVRPADGAPAPDALPVQFISMELVQGKTLSTLIHEEKTDVRDAPRLSRAGGGGAREGPRGGDRPPRPQAREHHGLRRRLREGPRLRSREAHRAARGRIPTLTSAPTRAADATGEGVLLGTTGYMSPEQVQGKAVDHRSDIFSFGCVLYEAVTRRRPFVADSAVETMHRILNEKPAAGRGAEPAAPAELRRLIRRCLAKSPDQRVQSMKDLALELREIADEWDSLSASATSGGSGSTTVARPFAVPSTRRVAPVLGGLAAIVVLAALAVAVWTLGGRGGRTSAGANTPKPFQNMKLSVLTSRGDVTEAALSGDGRFLAYLTGVVGHSSVRVRQVATGSDVEVVPSQDGIFSGALVLPRRQLPLLSREPARRSPTTRR